MKDLEEPSGTIARILIPFFSLQQENTDTDEKEAAQPSSTEEMQLRSEVQRVFKRLRSETTIVLQPSK